LLQLGAGVQPVVAHADFCDNLFAVNLYSMSILTAEVRTESNRKNPRFGKNRTVTLICQKNVQNLTDGNPSTWRTRNEPEPYCLASCRFGKSINQSFICIRPINGPYQRRRKKHR